MKFYLLVGLAALIVVASIASVIIYKHWYQHRFDDLIAEKAARYKLPQALIKAIIYTRDKREERIGLMGLPQPVYEGYQEAMMTRPYGFVCRNRNKPPHKKEMYNRRESCPICGAIYIQEFLHHEMNVEIGAWYLAYLRREINQKMTIESSITLNLALFAYLFDWETLMLRTTNLTDLFVADELAREEIYAKVLRRWAKYENQP